MVNKRYNLFISSKNRDSNEKVNDFTIYLKNQIIVNKNEVININITAFSMLNSMYNINSISKNDTFVIRKTEADGITLVSNTLISIPYGNYSVLTLRDTINNLCNSINISLVYNIPTNTYTFRNTNIGTYRWYIIPNNNNKILGISSIVEITNNYTSSFVNMVNYDQIIIRCPSLNFENLNQDNLRDKNNNLNISDIIFWINKSDIEPFRVITYKNEDANTSYSYNITDTNISNIQLQLYNENNEPITDASDYIIEIQIIISDKNTDIIKESSIQSLSILDNIYFTLLNIFFKKNNYLM